MGGVILGGDRGGGQKPMTVGEKDRGGIALDRVAGDYTGSSWRCGQM